MEKNEYIGEFLPDGRLTLLGPAKRPFAVGEKVRVIIESIAGKEKKPLEHMDPATKTLLKAIDNAQDIGASNDPEQLRHSVLFEERMEEKVS